MTELGATVGGGSAGASAPATQVKICGVTRPGDAEFADGAGADYVGVVLAEGFGRTIGLTAAIRILENVRSAIPVTVRVDDSYDRVMAEAEALAAGVVQLHGDESPEVAARIREGGFRVWKAVKVRSVEDVTAAATRFAGAVDGLLLDGWHPGAAGGTGTRFEWGDVDAVWAQIPEPPTLIVAGGLTPENVAEAVRSLRPGVVDVSSGVESGPGRKDLERVRAFIDAAR